jgi:hypothetical protein
VAEDVAHPLTAREILFAKRIRRDNASNTAHGPSVEQAECHENAEKRTQFGADRRAAEAK